MNAAGRFWGARSERERRILLVEPAAAGRTYWRQRLPALHAERAQMQALARQTGSTPPAHGALPPDRPALERSLADAGLKPHSLTVTDALVRARFSDVSFAALAGWLQQSQRTAQLAVTEANISARERIDRVDATLALRRLR